RARVARLPGMTTEFWRANSSPRRDFASGLCNSVSLLGRRAQGMPGARRTHCLACKTKKTHARPTQVRRNHSGTPCAMVLRLLRALPGVSGLLAPVAAQDRVAYNLTPASRGQDHAASP